MQAGGPGCCSAPQGQRRAAGSTPEWPRRKGKAGRTCFSHVESNRKEPWRCKQPRRDLRCACVPGPTPTPSNKKSPTHLEGLFPCSLKLLSQCHRGQPHRIHPDGPLEHLPRDVKVIRFRWKGPSRNALMHSLRTRDLLSKSQQHRAHTLAAHLREHAQLQLPAPARGALQLFAVSLESGLRPALSRALREGRCERDCKPRTARMQVLANPAAPHQPPTEEHRSICPPCYLIQSKHTVRCS